MFKFFGGKYRLARHYPPPAHRTIVEPFAGGAAYAVHHRRAVDRVVLIERDAAIVALWRELLGMSAAEIAAMPDPIEGERESRLLVALAAGRTTRDTPEKFLTSPRMAQRFRPMVNRIASVVDECRHFEIVHGDYSNSPDIAATWFVDPPYQYQGGRPDRTRGGRYPWGSDLIDYEALGRWTLSRRGQVIACEQDGASWLPFVPLVEVENGARQRYGEVAFVRSEVTDVEDVS